MTIRALIYIAFVVAFALTVTGGWGYAIPFLFVGAFAIGLFLLIAGAVETGIRAAHKN
jgi:hypothetical protein